MVTGMKILAYCSDFTYLITSNQGCVIKSAASNLTCKHMFDTAIYILRYFVTLAIGVTGASCNDKAMILNFTTP